ncbi:MAG: thioredoxin family protein [Acidobacteriota bacterium]
MHLPAHRARLLSLALVLLCFLATAPASQAQGEEGLPAFEPNGDYQLVLNGEPEMQAEIFQSRRAGAFLVRSAALSEAVVLSQRTQVASAVSVMSLALRPNGSIDILSLDALRPIGSFSLDGADVVFEIDGRSARLAPKPYTLGWKSLEEMQSSNPAYLFQANLYSADPKAMEALKGLKGDVKVEVFFGSWCPFCQRHVPRMMAVNKALEGSAVKVNYYGLDKGFGDNEEARSRDIQSVPTGIVYVEGKEVGRLEAIGWSRPEHGLLSALGLS